ncbi:hypothetical protein [Pantoea septica]|uniref:hypothetical protein n=1 Tax=Pantoea septica TaxID=472695 RepID=UPI0030B981A5
MMAELTLKDIYSRLDALASDAHKVACSLEIGDERTEAFALYTVLHRLLRRGAAVHIQDAINPLLVGRSTTTTALNDVIAERQRQVSTEGWTPEYDDQYVHRELAKAAGCYAMLNDRYPSPEEWPWAEEWWKPTTARRDLVKAGALILAEIERLDRVSGVCVSQQLEPVKQFSVTNQQYRAEVTSYDPQTRQMDHDSIDLTAEQYKALAQEMAPDLNRSAISDQTDIPANSLLATLAMSSLTEEDWPQHFYAATQSTRDIDGVGAVYLSEGVPDRVVESGIMRWNYYLVGKWRANVTVPVAADADEGYVAREAWLEARARLRSNKEIKASQ